MKFPRYSPVAPFVLLLSLTITPSQIWGRINPGAITGETQYAQHTAVPNAQLTLKNGADELAETTASVLPGQFNTGDLYPAAFENAPVNGTNTCIRAIEGSSAQAPLVKPTSPSSTGSLESSIAPAKEIGGFEALPNFALAS